MRAAFVCLSTLSPSLVRVGGTSYLHPLCSLSSPTILTRLKLSE